MRIFYLDEKYSTTRLISKELPMIEGNYGYKFEFALFLPLKSERKGEGGLRFNGYFKHSYRLENGNFDVVIKNGGKITIASCFLNEGEFDGNILKSNNEETSSNIQIPLVTVITSVFNGINYIEQTIQSVINQSYPNVEYIIIDGGSTDGTLDIIRKYENYIDYWISEKDEGIYDAWNKGVIVSLGDWISFLGAGDIYIKDALIDYCKVSIKSVNIDYISSKVELISGKKSIRIFGSVWRWNKLRRFMNIAHIGSFHSRKLFILNGLFNSKLKIAGDYEFFLRSGPNLNCGFLDNVTVKAETNGISQRSLLVFFETARVKIKYSGRNRFFIYFETLNAIIKWYIKRLIWYR